MIVADIYSDIKRATGLIPQDANFRYASDACEVLSNKGDFDILHQYLNITIPNGGNLIALPAAVESVVKVNIDGTPSFSRDRLYEFTMNGPGSDAERVDFSWERRGTVPIMTPLPLTASALDVEPYAIATDPADYGKTVTVHGTNSFGAVISNTVTLGAFPQGTQGYNSITRVTKDVTVGIVGLRTFARLDAPDTSISTLEPSETEPHYEQIRISKSGVTAHIFFRRRIFRITQMTDFIPIKSRRGLLYMIEALRKYDAGQNEAGQAKETLALKLATEEQQAYTTSIKLAGTTELQSIRGLNINNRDSIIAADVYDEASEIFGPIGFDKLLDKMTEAEELLANKGQWDPRVGSVDILTDQFHYVTLPYYVEEILALNICNRPAVFNNQWFEYHLNGPGSWYVPCNSWTKVPGKVCTFRDVNFAQKLAAIPDLSSDTGIDMRGYGWYQGKRIMTQEGAVMVDGFPINVSMSGAITPTAPFVDIIDRITKARSNGFIKLLGFDSSHNLQNTIGYYLPDETEPQYTRIRIGRQSTHVRIKYRKAVRRITKLTDPIHLGSKTGFVHMMKAVKLLNDGKYQEAATEEAVAVRLTEDEQRSSNPLQEIDLEFVDTCNNDNFVVA